MSSSPESAVAVATDPNVAGAATLAIIETPFQLLNVLEALAHLHLGACHLIILPWSYDALAFQPLLGMAAWASVRYFAVHSPELYVEPTGPVDELRLTFRQLRRRRDFDRLLESFRPVGTMLLGNYLLDHKGYMRHAHNVLGPRHVVLVDDGTDVLVVAHELREIEAQGRVRSPRVPRRTPIGRLRQKLRTRHIEWQDAVAPELTFFTAFDLKVRSRDRVVRNEYESLKTRLRKVTVEPAVVFLGQCLTEAGQMRQADYSACVGQVAAQFDVPMVYIPHPREAPENVRRLAAEHKVRILRPHLPFEMFVATTQRAPAHVSSFFSTALETCANLLGGISTITSFHLPMNLLLQDQDSIEVFYEHFITHSRETLRVRYL